MNYMNQTIEYLKCAGPGAFVENSDNGREVEVAYMAGGRYLCRDANGEPAKQTDSPVVAYMYLMGFLDKEGLR